MAESVANVYSTALFELCCEEDTLTRSFEELTAVQELIWQDKDYVKLLASPLVSGEDKVRTLEAVFEGRISGTVLDFLCLLAEKGRAGELDEIASEFRRMYNDKMGILEVTAITSQPMSQALADKLKAKLEEKSGKTVVLTTETDTSLIGGIVLRYGNNEIDSSVKSRLDELKASISGVIA